MNSGPLVIINAFRRGVVGHAFLAADDAADAFQVRFAACPQTTADHGVGIASVTISEAMMVLERHTAPWPPRAWHLALHELVVGFPVLAEAWVVLGVALHVLADLHAQVGLFNAGGNHGQGGRSRMGWAILSSIAICAARRARSSLTVGTGHALLRIGQGLGRVDHGAHEDAGLVNEARQRFSL